jgi:hypothetical protein
MKYYKFEKIVKGENPIIRVTYKTWHGSLIIKDICKCTIGGWRFMEDGDIVPIGKTTPINNFHKNNQDKYCVNG